MPSKVKAVFVWIAQILIGLLFVLVALPKLQAHPGLVERFHEWGFPAAKQMVVLTGILELVGGIGFLIPKTNRYGGVLLCMVMAGAFLTHLLHGEWPRLAITASLAGIIIFVMMNRRHNTSVDEISPTPSLATSK